MMFLFFIPGRNNKADLVRYIVHFVLAITGFYGKDQIKLFFFMPDVYLYGQIQTPISQGRQFMGTSQF